MKITFSKDIQGELYQRFLKEPPRRRHLPQRRISIGFYEHDTEGLIDTLLNDIADEMKEHEMEPTRYSDQGLSVENQKCYLDMTVEEIPWHELEKEFGKTKFPERILRRKYIEIYPKIVASGTVSYEAPGKNTIETMLDILDKQGYEARLNHLNDQFKYLASHLWSNKSSTTLNIYTGGSA